MSEIILAKSAGFCFGVSRSVQVAEEALEQGPCFSLGEVIHNKSVMEELNSKGLSVVTKAEEVPDGARVIIRAHGVGKSEYEVLGRKKAEVLDATCPYVRAIHKIVSEGSAQGKQILVLGARSHPEVLGICGWSQGAVVVENASELTKWLEEPMENAEKTVVMVAQTTQTSENMRECEKILKKEYTNAEIFDTICSATSTRQEEAIALASESDAMVVIGGRHSANSVHLAKLCTANCANTQFIESADELCLERLRASARVGVTAGASAPKWIIKEVMETMSDEILVQGNEAEDKAMTNEPGECTANEQVAEVAEVAQPELATNEQTQESEDTDEAELSFDQMLENSFKTVHNGERVTGVVVAITPTEISVDIGTKYSGFIPGGEFEDEDVKPAIGDSIETIVVRVNDVEGTAQLSKRRLDSVKFWAEIETAQESGEPVEGVVTEENKGGIVVSVKGVRVFVPSSQTGLPKDAPMADMLKQKVRLRITEVNRGRKRVVGSIRAVLQKERRERADEAWNSIEMGKQYDGVVKSLTSYGAFVDIGGVDGMVHVTELSWGRVRQPSDVVSVGDKLSVFVIGLDKETKRISLGCKRAEDNPWTKFTSTYEEGAILSVKIVKLMPFGAFAEIMPGVDGLIHISQIANRRIMKAEDVLTVGDEVEVKLTAIDHDKQKISLSIRALSEPMAEPARENEVEFETGPESDALVYEVSTDGSISGNIPDGPVEE